MIRIRKSAYKHGITDAQIMHALNNRITTLELDPHSEPLKTLVIGPDNAGNLLEILAVLSLNEEIDIIHAMPLRKKYRQYL